MTYRRHDTTRGMVSFASLFPLVLLLALYSTLILVASAIVLWSQVSSSPNIRETTIPDSLGGSISFTTGKSGWADASFAGLLYSMSAQQAIFAAWAIFAPGKWYFRAGAALLAAALLYALMRLSLAQELSREGIRPFLLIPLTLLSFAAPLSVLAIWSGGRLSRDSSTMSSPAGSRHFSITNLLWVTAVAAISLALARLRQDGGDEARAALFPLVYSAVHLLPLIWCALAIRRHWPALSTTLCITAIFSIPFIMAGIKYGDGPIQVGGAAGLVWTVPSSLMVWRFCGYRLVAVKDVAAA